MEDNSTGPTNNLKFEEVFIKEEPLDENSEETEFTDNLMDSTVKPECALDNNVNCNDGIGYVNIVPMIVPVGNVVNCNTSNQINFVIVNNVSPTLNIGPAKYNCSICCKGFALKSYLSVHMKRHTETKQYNCTLCEKTFRDKRNLKKHLKVHSGVKDYQCPICNKMYSQNHNLKTHLKTHSGDKPFKCSICNKSFIQKGSLQLHEKVHYGIKDFECDICHKKFVQPSNLKQHMNVHIPVAKKKKYNCTNCDKKFALKGKLMKHFKMCGLVATRYLNVI